MDKLINITPIEREKHVKKYRGHVSEQLKITDCSVVPTPVTDVTTDSPVGRSPSAS